MVVTINLLLDSGSGILPIRKQMIIPGCYHPFQIGQFLIEQKGLTCVHVQQDTALAQGIQMDVSAIESNVQTKV